MKRYIELNSDKSPKTDYNTFYSSTENIESAGLILDSNTVIVDFDKRPDIALWVLEKQPTKAVKTTRGYHLYYKIPNNAKEIGLKNASHITTVLGNKVDYKTGFNNKKSYAIVKLNGTDREVINADIDLPYLPKLLYPTKTAENLTEIQEGSRNDTLFKHLLLVSYVVQDNNDLLNIANVINNFLIKPLDYKEIENIVNSVLKKVNQSSINDVYDITEKGNKKLNIFKLSDFLIKKLNCTIYNETLYFKKGNFYSRNYRELKTLIKSMGFNLTKSQDADLLHQLYKTEQVVENDYLPIAFENGYSINNGNVVIYNGEFTPYNLNVSYDPKAYNKDVDNFLNWFVSYDDEMRILIEEILGHILMTSGFPQSAFFFVSNKGKNGKSTFFEMISNFCGDLSDNLALEELTKAESIATLRGKIVNCGDDIDDGHILSSRTFKNLVAGNKLMARDLYTSAIPLKNKATLLFSCNEMPKFKDKSGGVNRRIKIIPCDNVVKEQDLLIDEKLSTKEAKSYILNLALKGIQSILSKGGKMIDPERSIIETNEYIKDNDSVKLFLEYIDNTDITIDNTPTDTIYNYYSMFCNNEGIGSYSKSKFTRKLKLTGYESATANINGKSIRIYKYIQGV